MAFSWIVSNKADATVLRSIYHMNITDAPRIVPLAEWRKGKINMSKVFPQSTKVPSSFQNAMSLSDFNMLFHFLITKLFFYSNEQTDWRR